MPDGRPEGAPRDTTPGPDIERHHHPHAWGAEPVGDGRWRFALWSPEAGAVTLELAGAPHAMGREPDGFWSAVLSARAGDPYRYVVDGAPAHDPAARAALGLDATGPARLVDPGAYAWTTQWAGRPWEEAVIYELHVGTFTEEGTFAAAARKMRELADLGITAIELMPVAHFPGARGWGYDGILLAAPHAAYGTPEEMKALVETAQGAGLMVLLDVVMNHFSPEGSDMHRVAPGFFDANRTTPWGAAIAFEKPAVRSFFTDLCLGWLTEYRLDGLRLDAVHQILDPSEPHFLVELGRRIRATDFGRPIHLILEDERNLPDLRDTGLYTAQWNDDFHHAVHTGLTGEGHSHLARYAVDPVGDLALALAQGQVEVGQPRPGLDEPRGAPTAHLPWTAFVNHNQNHDQIGNHPGGRRLLAMADPRAVEVVHALLLTAPFTPMLFMGEEVGETAPFHFFCEVSPELGKLIHEGRHREFDMLDGGQEGFPDPNAPETFAQSRPFAEAGGAHARHWRELTRRLLALRRERIVPLLKSGRVGPAEVRRLGTHALSARWSFQEGAIAVHVNLGAPPDAVPPAGPRDLALYDLALDPFAFALTVSRT